MRPIKGMIKHCKFSAPKCTHKSQVIDVLMHSVRVLIARVHRTSLVCTPAANIKGLRVGIHLLYPSSRGRIHYTFILSFFRIAPFCTLRGLYDLRTSVFRERSNELDKISCFTA